MNKLGVSLKLLPTIKKYISDYRHNPEFIANISKQMKSFSNDLRLNAMSKSLHKRKLMQYNKLKTELTKKLLAEPHNINYLKDLDTVSSKIREHRIQLLKTLEKKRQIANWVSLFKK